MKLAIKGHATRGKEVIEILEMLGGENEYELRGTNEECVYFEKNGVICNTSPFSVDFRNIKLFTLEEFLEKYPYKVGDKVIIKSKNQEAIVDSVVWLCDTITYSLDYNDFIELNWRAEHLQLYKEETMKEKLEQIIYGIPKGYEFFGINDNNEIVLTKKQFQYPKTYEECCEILQYPELLKVYPPFKADVPGYNVFELFNLLETLRKLLICRDAYWKIAGEGMGLDKPWEPEWSDYENIKYSIKCRSGEIFYNQGYHNHKILAFPTKEMRDIFLENFKDLIEACKTLI